MSPVNTGVTSAVDSLPSHGPMHNDGTANDVIGMAWSTLSRKVWFRLNNGTWDDTSDNPTAGSGGFDITSLLANGAARLLWAGTSSDCSVTVNFGASNFLYAPPLDFLGPASLLPSTEQARVRLDVPITLYTGNGSTTTFALPEPCRAVPSADDVPTAYVNDVPVQGSHVSGTNIVLPTAPASGAIVMVCRTPDLTVLIAGQPNVDISDLNTQGIDVLTSSMRIEIIDAAHLSDGWDRRP